MSFETDRQKQERISEVYRRNAMSGGGVETMVRTLINQREPNENLTRDSLEKEELAKGVGGAATREMRPQLQQARQNHDPNSN